MKILVIAPSWVGDLMMSHTLYRCLIHIHPQASIDVMAPDWCRPLLLKMPEVAEALPMPIGHGELLLRQRYFLGRQLRTAHYQQAIVLPNSFKSALIPLFANIPRRTGWRGEMRYGLLNDLRLLDQQQYPLVMQRYAALAYDANHCPVALAPSLLPWPQLVVTAEEKLQTAAAFLLPWHQPLIGLCPGTALDLAKCWPPYHYATLAQQLITQGYWIALFGSVNDQSICEAIQKKLTPTLQTHCLNYAGKTTLTQAVSLLACCQAVVSNDSGLMHIAAALGKPVVALYGPTPPASTPPLTKQFRILPLEQPHHSAMRHSARQAYHPNLIKLHPTQVFNTLTSLLAMPIIVENS